MDRMWKITTELDGIFIEKKRLNNYLSYIPLNYLGQMVTALPDDDVKEILLTYTAVGSAKYGQLIAK